MSLLTEERIITMFVVKSFDIQIKGQVCWSVNCGLYLIDYVHDIRITPYNTYIKCNTHVVQLH